MSNASLSLCLFIFYATILMKQYLISISFNSHLLQVHSTVFGLVELQRYVGWPVSNLVANVSCRVQHSTRYVFKKYEM